MPPKRTWPIPGAIAALVLFSLVIPIGCLYFGALASLSFPGATPPDEDAHNVTRAFLIVGAISMLTAVVLALASAFAGTGVAVRIVAGFAIVMALVTGGLTGFLLLADLRYRVDTAPPPAVPIGPTCGPESHPTVFGGDSRYAACPDDVATAQDFLDDAVTRLPVENVTAASVDAVASGIAPATYEGAIEFDNGDIIVAWQPAPVTCATAVWRDGAWSPEVVGKLAEGGCIYVGG